MRKKTIFFKKPLEPCGRRRELLFRMCKRPLAVDIEGVARKEKGSALAAVTCSLELLFRVCKRSLAADIECVARNENGFALTAQTTHEIGT